jgi:Tfp pilus assembly protein PilE
MNDNKGFLLLEVMISIVIITSALLFVTRSYSVSKQAIERSRDLFKSGLLLEEEMFAFEETGEISEGSGEGEFNDNKDYLWKINAVPAANLNTVTVSVFRRNNPQEIYSLYTCLNKPGSATGAAQ